MVYFLFWIDELDLFVYSVWFSGINWKNVKFNIFMERCDKLFFDDSIKDMVFKEG